MRLQVYGYLPQILGEKNNRSLQSETGRLSGTAKTKVISQSLDSHLNPSLLTLQTVVLRSSLRDLDSIHRERRI